MNPFRKSALAGYSWEESPSKTSWNHVLPRYDKKGPITRPEIP